MVYPSDVSDAQWDLIKHHFHRGNDGKSRKNVTPNQVMPLWIRKASKPSAMPRVAVLMVGKRLKAKKGTLSPTPKVIFCMWRFMQPTPMTRLKSIPATHASKSLGTGGVSFNFKLRFLIVLMSYLFSSKN